VPSIAFDSDVSGDGSASWSAAGVLYVSCDLLALGFLPRVVDNSDHVIRAGWFSLGDNFDIGLGAHDYWRAPIYINFETQLWTPEVTGDGGGSAFVVTATRIRWHFATGVDAHLHVFVF
jgi:hypothetical protein